MHGAVVILAIVGLEHHHALVALECFLDLSDPGSQALFDLALLCLHGISPVIQRKYEDVDYKTQDYDRKSGIGEQSVYDRKHHLKE